MKFEPAPNCVSSRIYNFISNCIMPRESILILSSSVWNKKQQLLLLLFVVVVFFFFLAALTQLTIPFSSEMNLSEDVPSTNLLELRCSKMNLTA